jgi:BON domain
MFSRARLTHVEFLTFNRQNRAKIPAALANNCTMGHGWTVFHQSGFGGLDEPRCKGTIMLRATLLGAVCVLVVCGVIGHERVVMGQEKDSDSIGDKIDRGVRDVESKLRESWGDIKRGTHRMTVQGRVYARLYWDKSLADGNLKIEAKDGGVVVLKGTVPNRDARRRAVELAQSTVGVNDTVDELTLAPAKHE